jgi:hypothetical protein
MKQFKPTYLYVKTHNQTGLKYFGKTSKNPHTYKGSGKYWVRHLNVYGRDISTEIIGYFEDAVECSAAAIEFSVKNNIVSSNDWANLINENGLDGGAVERAYHPHSKETKDKISKANRGMIAWNKDKVGVTPGNSSIRTEETKRKISQTLTGTKQSAETVQKRAEANKGKKRSADFKKLISELHKGKKLSAEHIEKLKNRIVTDDTKAKIKLARSKQIFSEETKQKLSGKVIVIDKLGNVLRIPKEQYSSQSGPKDEWEYLFHRDKLATMRRN